MAFKLSNMNPAIKSCYWEHYITCTLKVITPIIHYDCLTWQFLPNSTCRTTWMYATV